MHRRKHSSIGRIVGFHGCDRQVAEKVLEGREELHTSTNEYDWLGSGTYFWVDSPTRALNWAKYLYDAGKISEPYVVGAFIRTGLCLNLLDYGVIDEVRDAYDGLLDLLNSAGISIPVNKGHRQGFSYERNLDAAVFNYLHDVRQRAGLGAYETVDREVLTQA